MANDIAPNPLVVRFPLLNRETSLLKSWSITTHYLTSTDGFEFTLYDEVFSNTQELELQPVELILNGIVQLIGRIDKTERGNDGAAVTCSGRDFMADMVECNVDPSLKVKLGDTMFKVIELAAGPVGITTVLSDEDIAMHTIRSGKTPPKGRGGSGHHKKRKRKRSHSGIKMQDFKPEPGQGIYDFLNKIVAREGATMQPGPNRNTVVIAEPTYEQDPLYAIARTRDTPQGIRSNIEHATATRDFSKFPTFTMLHGQQARGGQKGANVTKTFDMWAIAAAFRSELNRILTEVTVSGRQASWLPEKIAAEVRQGWLYRLLVHKDEVARDAEQVEKAAQRAIAERLKDTLEYRVRLRGHIDPESGAIYSVDTMIQVDDEICDVHEPLWIAERTLAYAEHEGAGADLTCWRPESFQLGITEPETKPKPSKSAQDIRNAAAVAAIRAGLNPGELKKFDEEFKKNGGLAAVKFIPTVKP